MASDTRVLRTCGLILYLLFHVNASFYNNAEPRILSLKINSKICEENTCKYFLNVSGGEFIGHYSWRLTPLASAEGGNCDVIHPNHEIKEITSGKYITTLQIILPNRSGKIYFCVLYDDEKNIPFGGKWVHQGVEYYLDPKNDLVTLESLPSTTPSRNGKSPNAKIEETTPRPDLSRDIAINYLPNVPKVSHNEKRDIEVLVQDKYVSLNDLQRATKPNDRTVFGQTGYPGRYKRNVLTDKRINSRLQENEAYNEDDYKIDPYGRTSSSIDDETEPNHKLDINTSSSTNHPITKHNTIGLKRNHTTNKIKPKVSKIPSSVIRKRNLETILKEFYKDNNFTSDAYKKSKHKQDKVKSEARASILGLNDGANAGPGKVRKPRQSQMLEFTSVRAEQVPVIIEGIRVEDSAKDPKIIEGGIPSVQASTIVSLRLFGEGLTPRTVIAFTHHEQTYGQPCKFLLKGEYMVREGSLGPRTALFDIKAPASVSEQKLYICAKNLRPGLTDPTKDEEKYVHQGNDPFKIFAIHSPLLPLWVSMILILVCLTFSALFSGLNLGLMSLDRTELKIISNTGTEQERKYARAIMPVRDHGNYLLCSILLGNVAVNSTFTILLDELTSGLFAVIFSTLAIVLLGEITPQAICSRHGLMIGAKSIMITKSVMALTAPMAFPVSKLLDYFLGEEIGSVYNRERLKELVKVTTDVNDLDKDEVNIISGALELRKKTVSDVMTKLEDVFMLPISSVLDFETMSEIVKSGYSRIPVYEGSRGNIVTVLFIKDLAFVDPDDNTPLRTLCQYYQNPCNFVFEDVTLDVMFKQFKEGHKGHMAFVHRINNEGEGDPFYETIGLVTLEDVIEEMIQAEIVDETDVFMDNRTKRRRNRPQNKLQDFAAFAERHEHQRIHISPQLTLATFQFLSTSVDAFRPDTVSETVLRRLLRQDVIHHIKLKGKTKKDPTTYVFQQGKPVDYFVLILEGRVEVTVGRENLVFEAGPFTYFGVQALTQNVGVAESPTPSAMGSLQNINMDSMLRHTFVPDYSVRAIAELYYLTVKRTLYLAAKRATLMEKGALSKGAINEQFDNEVDKNLCNSSSANIPISLISRKLLGKSASNTVDADSNDMTRDKYSSRQNIIELMQVCQNYTSSEMLDECDQYVKQNSPNIWPNDPNTVQSTNCEENDQPSMSERSTNVGDRTGTGPVVTDDDMTCAECVENNYWMDNKVAKSLNDKPGSDHVKKKKATFHTDSSLLTFHHLYPSSHDQIDSKSIDYKTFNSDIDLNLKSKDATKPYYRDIQCHRNDDNYRQPNNQDIDSKPLNIDYSQYNSSNSNCHIDCVRRDFYNHDCLMNDVDCNRIPNSIDCNNRFPEYERRNVFYDKESKEERTVLQKRRQETDQMMLDQLARILAILERNPT